MSRIGSVLDSNSFNYSLPCLLRLSYLLSSLYSLSLLLSSLSFLYNHSTLPLSIYFPLNVAFTFISFLIAGTGGKQIKGGYLLRYKSKWQP